MKQTITTLLFVVLLASHLFSQEITIDWSQKIQCDNKAFGFFDGFIGTNSQYVYAKYSNLANMPKNRNESIRYVAYDKETMKVASEKILCGFGTKKGSENKYKKLKYLETIVFENSVFVFWSNEDSNLNEILAESFDADLKPLTKLTKIYSGSYSDPKKKYSDVVILSNKTVGENILIVDPAVQPQNKGVELEYVLLNKDLEDIYTNKIELPFEIDQELDNLTVTGSYTYGEDGNLYVLCSVAQSEKKVFRRMKARYDSFFSVVNLKNGSAETLDIVIEDENKFILAREFNIQPDGILIFGFYRNISDDEKKGFGADGVFSAKIDSKNYELGKMKFTEFDAEFIKELYAEDPEAKAEDKKKSNKKKEKEDQSELDWNYEIEVSRVIDGEVIMMCTKMYNYTVQSCDSKGNCTTRYYCRKEDVTAIKLDKKGGIAWASNLDRSVTYSGWNVRDVKVFKENNTLYVSYGSGFMDGAEKKNRKSAKSKEVRQDLFEYATLNLGSGGFEKQSYRLNKANAAKDDKKIVSAANISVLDNVMYVNTVTTKIKPTRYLACLIPCPIVWWWVFLSPSSKVGKGNLGRVKTA